MNRARDLPETVLPIDATIGNAVRFEFVRFDETDVSGSLLVTGIPSVGMVGSIAAGFLAKHLRMRMIASVQSEALPPVGVVRNGVVTSPIQVWASDAECGVDGECERLLVLKSDIPLPANLLVPLADAVVTWAVAERVRVVVGLEGYPEDTPAAGGKATLAVSNVAAGAVLERIGVARLGEATIAGFNAALLVRANRTRLPALALLAPVKGGAAGASAAATLLDIVDPLLPNIGLEPSTLAKKAEEIEIQLRAERKQQERAQREMELVDRGYA